MPHILKRKNPNAPESRQDKEHELDKLRGFIHDKKPHVIAVAGESRYVKYVCAAPWHSFCLILDTILKVWVFNTFLGYFFSLWWQQIIVMQDQEAQLPYFANYIIKLYLKCDSIDAIWPVIKKRIFGMPVHRECTQNIFL